MLKKQWASKIVRIGRHSAPICVPSCLLASYWTPLERRVLGVGAGDCAVIQPGLILFSPLTDLRRMPHAYGSKIAKAMSRATGQKDKYYSLIYLPFE